MYGSRYDYDVPEPSAEGEKPDWDAETEYKEQCLTNLVNAVADCRHFLSFREMLRILLEHEV